MNSFFISSYFFHTHTQALNQPRAATITSAAQTSRFHDHKQFRMKMQKKSSDLIGDRLIVYVRENEMSN